MQRRPPNSPLFPYTTLFRSGVSAGKFATMVEDKPIVAIQEFLKGLDKMDAASQNQALASVGIKGALRPGEIKKLRSEEHTSELQSQFHLVCRLLLEKKKFNH